jgi:hypothetical protein
MIFLLSENRFSQLPLPIMFEKGEIPAEGVLGGDRKAP